jgi:hypothetical protein
MFRRLAPHIFALWVVLATPPAGISSELAIVDPTVLDPSVAMPEPFDAGAVGVSDDGAFLVVWRDGARLYTRAFDASGAPRGERRELASYGPPPHTTAPRVAAAALPNGDFVVLWVRETTPGLPDRVMARLFDPAGSPRGPGAEIGQRDDVYLGGGRIALAGEASGTLTLAWQEQDHVRVRRFVVAGAQLVPAGGPIDAGVGSEPSLALVPGGVIVAGSRRILAGGVSFVRAFAHDGVPLGPERVIGATGGSPPLVEVAADPAGRFLLAWQEYETAGGIASRIRAQRFAADGSLLGDPILVVSQPPPEWAIGPWPVLQLGAIAASAEGAYVVGWSTLWLANDCPLGGLCTTTWTEGTARVRLVDADGTLRGHAVEVAGGSAAARAALVGLAPRGAGWLVATTGDALAAARLDWQQPCGPAATTVLCLADRFRVSLEHAVDDAIAFGRPLRLTRDTGSFWLFAPTNVELVAKLVDGTSLNDHFWVFYAALTDVAFDLVVTDTLTGRERRYHNPRGRIANGADTSAFPATLP